MSTTSIELALVCSRV